AVGRRCGRGRRWLDGGAERLQGGDGQGAVEPARQHLQIGRLSDCLGQVGGQFAGEADLQHLQQVTPLNLDPPLVPPAADDLRLPHVPALQSGFPGGQTTSSSPPPASKGTHTRMLRSSSPAGGVYPDKTRSHKAEAGSGVRRGSPLWILLAFLLAKEEKMQ